MYECGIAIVRRTGIDIDKCRSIVVSPAGRPGDLHLLLIGAQASFG
jgi:hypothetical protein